jgi:hypothetical protein
MDNSFVVKRIKDQKPRRISCYPGLLLYILRKDSLHSAVRIMHNTGAFSRLLPLDLAVLVPTESEHCMGGICVANVCLQHGGSPRGCAAGWVPHVTIADRLTMVTKVTMAIKVPCVFQARGFPTQSFPRSEKHVGLYFCFCSGKS